VGPQDHIYDEAESEPYALTDETPTLDVVALDDMTEKEVEGAVYEIY
jgi:hypothetical protein